MEGKDFRERLRNGDAEYSAEKWQQMSQLLDSADADRKRSPLWFWFMFSFIMVIIVYAGYQFTTSQNTDTSKSAHIDTSATEYSESNKNNTLTTSTASRGYEETPSIQDVDEQNTQDIAERSAAKEGRNISDSQNVPDGLELVARIDDSDVSSEDMVRFNKERNVGVSVDNIEMTVIEDKKNVASDNNKNIENNLRSDAVSNVDKTSESHLKAEARDTHTGNAPEIINTDEADAVSQRIPDIMPLKNIDHILSRSASKELNLGDYQIQDIKKAPSIYAGKYIFLQGGPARFNNNGGLHVGAGFMWDINKIIGLESQLGYSYGQDRSNVFEQRYEREWQMDVNLLFNLYLIRTRDFGFSFNLGAGHTIYRGTRINPVSAGNNIDERRSSGRNLQGGLSVHYRVHKHAVGLKFGAISYDDGVTYLSARYLYRF